MLLPEYFNKKSACRSVASLAVRKRWIVGAGEVGTEVPVMALTARMTRWDVGGRQSHSFVSFFASCWAKATGGSALAVISWVAKLVRTPVIPR